MNALAKDWLTEGLIDFEYKKYILLAYLKKVQEHFKDKKLYPDFTELISHFRYLKELKQTEEALQSAFKKPIEAIELDKLAFKYQSELEEEWLKEIKQIIEFGLPLMAKEVMEGKSIFDFVEKNIQFEPLGILPIIKNEGYFILQPVSSKNVSVYSFCLSPITYLNEKAFGFKTDYFSTFTLSLAQPLDKIKQEIIFMNPYLPNPAVYVFKAKVNLPDEETFLPVAKRLLYSTLSSANKI